MPYVNYLFSYAYDYIFVLPLTEEVDSHKWKHIQFKIKGSLLQAFDYAVHIDGSPRKQIVCLGFYNAT